MLVTAPEDDGAEAASELVLAATPIRQGAGRIEQYLVRLTGEQLTAAGIPLPTTSAEAVEGTDLVVARLVTGGRPALAATWGASSVRTG